MRLRTFALLLGLSFGLPSLAHAQATAQSKLGWDQAAPDLPTANGYTYRHYDDVSATGVPLTPATCTGTASPFACQAPFPAFTPGATHTVAVTAANVAGESLKSTPLSFTFIVIPSVPANLRLIP